MFLTDLFESDGKITMGKLAGTGKIVRIIRKAHDVKFSDEKGWLLIDTDPGKGNRGQGLKWIPADTRFEWVRDYKEKIDEFAPSQPKDDGDERPEDILKRYAARWYNGNASVQKEVEYILQLQGWNIGEIESEEGGAFIIRAGDINGDSYVGWTAEDLGQSLDEGVKQWLAGVATVGAMIFGAPDAGAITQQQYNQTAQMLASTPAETLKKVAVASGITGSELAQFMAQVRHESADFSRMKEIGGKHYFAQHYDPKFAPKTAKILGNTQVGDGERYKGRGFIQLTGRDNYKRAGQALGLPLEQRPELVERPDVAAKVAVWFWQNRVAPKVASYHDTAQVTKPINPGMRGLKDRNTKFNAIKQGAMATQKDLAPRGRRI